jgi:hypothetical protein
MLPIGTQGERRESRKSETPGFRGQGSGCRYYPAIEIHPPRHFLNPEP